MRQEAQKPPNKAESVERKPRVLVFDQDAADLARQSEFFEGKGFVVHRCSSVEKAMRYVERKSVDFALIDLGSPALEGFLVFRHFVRYHAHVLSVVTTRAGDTVGCREALAMGAMECLEKPVSGADLKWVIQKYVGSTVRQSGRRKRAAEENL